MQITNKLTAKIYSKTRSWLQPLSPAIYQTHKKTQYDMRKMQNHLWSNFWKKWPLSHNNS